MVPDLIGNKLVDRIAILVSYNGTTKFLGAPKVASSTGLNIATTVHNVLVQWNITDSIKSICFDTTSHNTGVDNGACVLLERMLGRELMHAACRHHIYELDLKTVFELKISASSAPNVTIFDRFAKKWDELDHNSWKSGLEDEIVTSSISPAECEAMKKFCYKQLEITHSRNDYKEFLQLALMFLGDG